MQDDAFTCRITNIPVVRGGTNMVDARVGEAKQRPKGQCTAIHVHRGEGPLDEQGEEGDEETHLAPRARGQIWRAC